MDSQQKTSVHLEHLDVVARLREVFAKTRGLPETAAAGARFEAPAR
jgi:hypothetical protein